MLLRLTCSHWTRPLKFWPSYEDILGPFAGHVKQVIAKERHSPCENLMNSPKRIEGTCHWLTELRGFSRLLLLEGAIDLAPPPIFFFSWQRFYCSRLMTVFQAPNTLFRQHFEGPRLFHRSFSLFFFSSFSIKYWFWYKPALMPFFFLAWLSKKVFLYAGFFCEGTILLIKY